jgi:phosphopantothenoylcysteine decarboxylase/phosphopantothenate--cysteine ligase
MSKGRKIHVGFALEVENALENARSKLAAKNLDFIVLNDPATFGAETMSAMIIDRKGILAEFKSAAKETVAKAIIEQAEKIYAAAGKAGASG